MTERGAGDALILLHGVGARRSVWHRVLGPLASRRRVIALDLPGFGDSPPVGRGFDLDRVARRCAEAAAERVDGPFDLLGHSLGGAVAVALADDHPNRVRSLVLLAPAGFTPRPPRLAVAAGAVAAGVLAVRRIVGPPLLAVAPVRRALLWGAVLDGSRMPIADARVTIESSGRSTRARQAIAAVLAADLRDRLARLTMPVGLLWGEHDRIVRGAIADDLRAARPDAPFETIAEAGHIPQLERPHAFVESLERLFDRLQAAAAHGERITD